MSGRGVTGVRQGTHLEKRVRFSGPGSRGASELLAMSGADRRPRPRPGRRSARVRGRRPPLLRRRAGARARSRSRRVLAARGGVWFRAGAHELHVGVADEFVPAAKAHPALRVLVVDALERLAATLGGEGSTSTWADPAEIPGSSAFFAQRSVGQPRRARRLRPWHSPVTPAFALESLPAPPGASSTLRSEVHDVSAATQVGTKSARARPVRDSSAIA